MDKLYIWGQEHGGGGFTSDAYPIFWEFDLSNLKILVLVDWYRFSSMAPTNEYFIQARQKYSFSGNRESNLFHWE